MNNPLYQVGEEDGKRLAFEDWEMCLAHPQIAADHIKTLRKECVRLMKLVNTKEVEKV